MEKVYFVTHDEAEVLPESGIGGMGGWFKQGMRWPDYLNHFKPEAHERLEALRAAIIENGIRCKGDEHQNTAVSCPVFEDGTTATYSFRAWGDLMAAIWATAENVDYWYMDFYCC